MEAEKKRPRLKKLYAIEIWRRSSGWQGNRKGSPKSVWATISCGYIYLCYNAGRAYWILSNMTPAERPLIAFKEKERIIKVNTYRIRFLRAADFRAAREALAGFGRPLKSKRPR